MAGPEGAAFCASVLMVLQDIPIDMACHYTADTCPWGLFDSYGVPNKNFYTFVAFRQLLDTPHRVRCEGVPADDSMAICAGVSEDRKAAAFLLSNFRARDKTFAVTLRNLPWNGDARLEFFAVDETHDFALARQDAVKTEKLVVSLEAPAPSVIFVRVRQP